MEINNCSNLSNEIPNNLQPISGNNVCKKFTDHTVTWHEKDPQDKKYTENISHLLETLHLFNFKLWHEEDQARRTDVSDAVIAHVKRNIDIYNQKRNDYIEEIDKWILKQLKLLAIEIPDDAELNSETPGSILDRLSILSLKIYHMAEQTKRTDVLEAHIARAKDRLRILKEQRTDLAKCLDTLILDLVSGRKRLKLYLL